MKVWLVVLLLYPTYHADRWVGPYEDEQACERAVRGFQVNLREGAPDIAIYCEDGCGQQRLQYLTELRRLRQ